jgi:mono/diheme cytochrome c family protein
MKKTSVRALLVLVALIGGTTAAAQSSTGNAENGKRLYLRDGCYQCHGFAGQGGRAGARIAAPKFNAQALIMYVRRPAGDMPAYSGKVISDQELTDIYAYLKTFPPAKASKEIPLLDQLRDR